MSVFSFLKGFGNAVYTDLLKIFGATAVQKVESEFSVVFESDVKQIFIDAVTAVQATNETAAQKKAAAFAKIAADLAADGKSLATWVINGGIEIVLGLLKAQGAPGFAS